MRISKEQLVGKLSKQTSPLDEKVSFQILPREDQSLNMQNLPIYSRLEELLHWIFLKKNKKIETFGKNLRNKIALAKIGK